MIKPEHRTIVRPTCLLMVVVVPTTAGIVCAFSVLCDVINTATEFMVRCSNCHRHHAFSVLCDAINTATEFMVRCSDCHRHHACLLGVST
jgi:hypothetical protein